MNISIGFSIEIVINLLFKFSKEFFLIQLFRSMPSAPRTSASCYARVLFIFSRPLLLGEDTEKWLYIKINPTTLFLVQRHNFISAQTELYCISTHLAFDIRLLFIIEFVQHFLVISFKSNFVDGIIFIVVINLKFLFIFMSNRWILLRQNRITHNPNT